MKNRDHGSHEKPAGQLFCDQSSKQIVAMLQAECDAVAVTIMVNSEIGDIVCEDGYRVACRHGEFHCESLVVATGGLSIPKMGASDFGYRVARQFGLKVLETRAGLVPFTFTGTMKDMSDRLSGVSVPARLATDSQAFTENILFTHRGLSGPAALQISSYWLPGMPVTANLCPTRDLEKDLLAAKQSQPKSLLRTTLSEWLPRALVLELQPLLWPRFAETSLAEIPDDALRSLAAQLGEYSFRPAATEGYRTAEVTLGGIDTRELSSRTMEARRQPGLFCIGEVVDVTGHLGGFNFQWAWASGHAAGQVV